jgi:hypothetical protein
MLDSEHLKPAAGFDAHIHFRAPSDLMPAVHAHARRRGMIAALDRATTTPADHQEAA